VRVSNEVESIINFVKVSKTITSSYSTRQWYRTRISVIIIRPHLLSCIDQQKISKKKNWWMNIQKGDEIYVDEEEFFLYFCFWLCRQEKSSSVAFLTRLLILISKMCRQTFHNSTRLADLFMCENVRLVWLVLMSMFIHFSSISFFSLYLV
jgi:hypothetical protein